MKFAEPYSTSRTIAGRFRRIDILPDLLNLWWGAGSGPQVPGALVETNAGTIDELLALMIEEGRIDPASNDAIILREIDFTG